MFPGEIDTVPAASSAPGGRKAGRMGIHQVLAGQGQCPEKPALSGLGRPAGVALSGMGGRARLSLCCISAQRRGHGQLGRAQRKLNIFKTPQQSHDCSGCQWEATSPWEVPLTSGG